MRLVIDLKTCENEWWVIMLPTFKSGHKTFLPFLPFFSPASNELRHEIFDTISILALRISSALPMWKETGEKKAEKAAFENPQLNWDLDKTRQIVTVLGCSIFSHLLFSPGIQINTIFVCQMGAQIRERGKGKKRIEDNKENWLWHNCLENKTCLFKVKVRKNPSLG